MFFVVINHEVYAVVGETIIVPPSVRVTISCSRLINSSTIAPFNITWHLNGFLLTNSSGLSSIVSQDKHSVIIKSTELTVGGQLGNSGNYSCTTCSSNNKCDKRQSRLEVCGKRKL